MYAARGCSLLPCSSALAGAPFGAALQRQGAAGSSAREINRSLPSSTNTCAHSHFPCVDKDAPGAISPPPHSGNNEASLGIEVVEGLHLPRGPQAGHLGACVPKLSGRSGEMRRIFLLCLLFFNWQVLGRDQKAQLFPQVFLSRASSAAAPAELHKAGEGLKSSSSPKFVVVNLFFHAKERL